MTDRANLKILIVEDEAVVAMSLKLLLEVHGHYTVVGTADDLQGALRLADAERPDLALVDIQLARGSSGLDVAAQLQSRKIPCLFMTGNPPARPRPDLTLGVLCKPFGDEALFKALEAAQDIIDGKRPTPSELPPELKLYV